MVVAIAVAELHIPAARGLKEKRKVVKSLIDRLTHRYRISIAETVRQLVRAGLRAELGDQPPGPRAGALLALAGIGKSGLGDLGRRHDEYLAEDFGR